MRAPVLAVALLLAASPAGAQLGRLGDLARRAGDMHISDREERQIGEAASDRVRKEFGVLQDAAVTKYVSLVGIVLARASSRPDLSWEFIVLDTDGVNAFAAPGGLVHITKGALGLIKSEAQLAGVLGHEIAHVTKKHTVNALTKSKGTKAATEAAGSRTSGWITQMADAAYDNIVERGFDRGEENEADQEGVRLASKAGYNPSGLATFLEKLVVRNKDNKGGDRPNGLFSTHPETNDRITKITRQITNEKLFASALGEPRYAAQVKFTAKAITELAVSDPGTRGLTGGGSSTAKKEDPPKEAEKKEGEKKGGGMFGGIANRLSGGKQKEGNQASASMGTRGVGREDRFAKGGSNPAKVQVTLTAAEIETFRKGIA